MRSGFQGGHIAGVGFGEGFQNGRLELVGGDKFTVSMGCDVETTRNGQAGSGKTRQRSALPTGNGEGSGRIGQL
jgi:hypothetical protein